ncbi:MAG: hypothetical protein JST68_04970 [Bacteroidetes bacterium]|nr:hypothetical protein [Bacteroidota bacterium]
MKKFALTLFVCALALLAQSQWTTSGNDIFNNNTGNVGIGTSTPQYRLDVKAPGSSTALFAVFQNSTNSHILELKENQLVGFWRVYNPMVGHGMAFSVDAGSIEKGAFTFSTNSSSGAWNNTGSRSFFYIGDYSINNTSSGGNYTFNNLQIAPTIANTQGTTLARGIYYNPTMTATGGTFTHIAYENTYGTNILNSTSGNTLVGTSTDNGNKLQVNGTTWTTALALPTGAAAGKVLTSDANGNATWQTPSSASAGWSLTGNATVDPATTFLGTTDNTPVVFRTGNTERIRIDGSTGNLLIGKSFQANTSYKLDISGIIRTDRIIVNTTGADFVFDPSYSLTPLLQVEAYIKQNHHLPGIAPASQMQKDGVDVGDHETKLLQKIEELTLYIIEQDKKNVEQDRMNKSLQDRLDHLEKLLEKPTK